MASKAGSGGKGGASSSEPAPVRLSQPGTPPQPYWGGAPSYPILPPAPLLRPGSPAPNERWLDTEFYNAAGEGFNKYDPTDWLATLKFEMTSFMFPPWAIITGGCLLGTAYIELIAPEHRDWVSAPLDAHTIMGAALSFLVVMRTDASMNRWWDARSAWAAIGNCCLSIGATVAPSLRDEAATEQLLMQLMAFAVSLKCYLRDEKIQLEEVGSRMDAALIRKLNASVCPPLQALRAIMETTKANLPDAGPPSPDKRGGAASLASAVFDEVSEQVRQIQQFVGTCRKIKTTPMTLGYVTTVRSIMLLWLATLPVALIGEFGWLAPPIIGFVAFLFLNVEQMAIEIEQPFGDDANDLPQESYIIELEEMLLEMAPGNEPEAEPDDGQPGGAVGAEGVGEFINKYRMSVEMSNELIGLLHGAPPSHMAQQQRPAATPAPAAYPDASKQLSWNHVSPDWRQSTRGTALRA